MLGDIAHDFKEEVLPPRTCSSRLYDRWCWLTRSKGLRALWCVAFLVGQALFFIKWTLGVQTGQAKFTFSLIEDKAMKLAKNTTENDSFRDEFHRVALRVVPKSLLGSDMKDFVSIVPFSQMLEKKLRIEKALMVLAQAGRTVTRPPAVFIIGLPRTGSTLMHQLCAADPRARTLRAWELRMPFEMSDAPADPKARLEKTQKILNAFYSLAPAIKTVHYVRATDPDECVQGYVDCALPEWYLWGAVDAPEAFHWYVSGDMTPMHRNYENLVRLLTYEDAHRYQNLWLKTPHHTYKLPELAAAFPEAKFVWLHRDPVKSVGSCCSMNEAILDATCPRFVDPHVLGHRTLERLSICVKKGMRDRSELESKGRVFVDVNYDDFKKDALGEFKKMYRKLGLIDNFPIEFESALSAASVGGAATATLKAKDSNMPVHRYSLAHFGLTESMVNREFRGYLQTYLAKD